MPFEILSVKRALIIHVERLVLNVYYSVDPPACTCAFSLDIIKYQPFSLGSFLKFGCHPVQIHEQHTVGPLLAVNFAYYSLSNLLRSVRCQVFFLSWRMYI